MSSRPRRAHQYATFVTVTSYHGHFTGNSICSHEAEWHFRKEADTAEHVNMIARCFEIVSTIKMLAGFISAAGLGFSSRRRCRVGAKYVLQFDGDNMTQMP